MHDADGKKNTSASFIGHINPLRYRGYYYDRETRLYYLQSRYYDFANCRFINADTFATTDANGFLSANMFAYCENNPVSNSDSEGKFPVQVIAAAVSGVVNLATSWASAKATGQTFTFLDGAVAFVAGAVGVLAQPAGSLRLLYQVLGQRILLAEMAVAQLERFPVEH